VEEVVGPTAGGEHGGINAHRNRVKIGAILMSRIVTTPTVDNFLLPINNFDQNDVFLNKDSIVDNKS